MRVVEKKQRVRGWELSITEPDDFALVELSILLVGLKRKLEGRRRMKE